MSRAADADCGIAGLEWSLHARRRWSERSDCPGRDLDDVWRESQVVDYPSARGDSWGQYHSDGDVVLISRQDGQLTVIQTVIDLDDRSAEEQEYVRCQARYGGGE